jgi:hypothetical protein
VSFSSGRTPPVLTSFASTSCTARGVERFPAHHGGDGVGQLLRGEVLGEVAVRAIAHRARDVLGLDVQAQHHDARAACVVAGLAQHLEAVAARHVEIQQQHVGLELGELLERLDTVSTPRPPPSIPGEDSSTLRTPARTSS